MARKQNETGKEAWEATKEFREYGLPPADLKVMVMQLADSARRLKDCGDDEGAADAAATAILYAVDAGMDSRFRRALRKFQLGTSGELYRRPKFNPETTQVDPHLKNKLLR